MHMAPAASSALAAAPTRVRGRKLWQPLFLVGCPRLLRTPQTPLTLQGSSGSGSGCQAPASASPRPPPPPAPTGDSSSGHPPSSPSLRPGPAGAGAAGWALPPTESCPTYPSSLPGSAHTPGKQTQMESHGAARRMVCGRGKRSAWVAKVGFPAFGN